MGVPRDQVVGLPEDTYYVFDLIGLKVIDRANGERLGEITDQHPGKVVLTSGIGGSRVVCMLSGEQLPRIC